MKKVYIIESCNISNIHIVYILIFCTRSFARLWCLLDVVFDCLLTFYCWMSDAAKYSPKGLLFVVKKSCLLDSWSCQNSLATLYWNECVYILINLIHNLYVLLYTGSGAYIITVWIHVSIHSYMCIQSHLSYI